MAYSCSCIAFNFAIGSQAHSAPSNADWPQVVIFAWIFGVLAAMGWISFLIGVFARGLPARVGAALPRRVSVSQQTLQFDLGGMGRYAFALDDIQELVLNRNAGDTAMPNAGVGVRLKDGGADVIEPGEIRERLRRNRRRYGYDVWIRSSSTGNRKQIADFWAWIRSMVGPERARELEIAKRSKRWIIWLVAGLVTLWTIATVLTT